MPMDITNLGHINNYFKSVSGFVPNKYLVTINDNRGSDDESWGFYAKSVSIPQVKINTVNDIYVSNNSLAKPTLALSAETSANISISFRDDQNLGIYNKLVRYHESLIGSSYEVSGNTGNIVIGIKIFNNSSVVYAKTFKQCSLFDLVDLKVDHSSRKFLEYEATFVCNDMLNSLYEFSNPNSIMKDSNTSIKNSCAELQQKYQEAVTKFKTYKVKYNYINKNSSQNTLNNQTGETQLGIPTVRLFNDSAAVDRNARSNAEIQIDYFMTYVKPAIDQLRSNGCPVPAFPAIDGTYPAEIKYVKDGLKNV